MKKWLAGLVLAGWCGAAFGGLSLISASDDEITVHLDPAVAGAIRLIEIEPYDTFNPLRGMASASPESFDVDLANEGFVRITFVDASPFEPKIKFPEYPVHAGYVGQFTLRARVTGTAGGAALPIRVSGDSGAAVDLTLPADGQWHLLRAELPGWSGWNVLELHPAHGQGIGDHVQTQLDIDWVAVTYRDDFSGDRNRTGYDVFIDLGVPHSSWAGTAQTPIVLPRYDGLRDRLYAKYVLLEGAAPTQIGAPRFVTDLSGLSYSDRRQPLLMPAGFKGLDDREWDDKIDLGIQVNKINLIQRNALNFSDTPPAVWLVDEFEIGIGQGHINGNTFGVPIKQMTDHGIPTHVIFLNSLQNVWIDEGTSGQRFNPLRNIRTEEDVRNAFSVAHNVVDPVGLAHFRGALEYLGWMFSDPSSDNGQIFRFTIGNEVDAHAAWYNIGDAEMEEVVDLYLVACRMADLALRSRHPDYRIKLSFTKHWNKRHRDEPLRACKPKEFLELFAARAREEGDFPWALNIHTYPVNLRNAEFWNDTEPVDAFDSEYNSFKNLQMIRRYMQQEPMLYNGRVRPITLGEQGFDVRVDGDEEREAIQAAALAYSLKIVEQVPDIEAYLYHRGVDHPNEGGLLFGLWAGDPAQPDQQIAHRKRPSWTVMRDYGTQDEAATFDPYLAYLPISDWAEINIADIVLRYTFDEPDADFSTQNMLTHSISNGVFSGTADHHDPQIIKTNVNTVGDGQEIAVLRLRSGQSGEWKLYWRRAGDAGFSEQRAASVFMEASDRFRIGIIDLSSHAFWSGHNITAWRLDPPGSASPYSFEIDYLLFEPKTGDPLPADRLVWTGNVSTNWSQLGNWDAAYLPGSLLEFAGALNTETWNDYSEGLLVGGIVFNSDAAPFTLGGHSVLLDGDIGISAHPAAAVGHVIELDMQLAGEEAVVSVPLNGGITINGAISGEGAVVKSGEGALTLAGENSLSGGITAEGGMLVLSGAQAFSGGIKLKTGAELHVRDQVSNIGNLGAMTNPVVFEGGTLRVIASGEAENFTTGEHRQFVLSGNGSLHVEAGRNLRHTGLIEGSGTITVDGPGPVTPSNTGNTFSGNWNLVNGGTVWVATAQEGSAARLGSGARLDMDQGTLLFSGNQGGDGNTHARDTLLGEGGGTFILGNADNQNPKVIWTGDMSGPGGLTVSNNGGTTGEFTLAGTSTYAGNTTVHAGSLLRLTDGGSLRLVIGESGENSRIAGTGTVELNGTLAFDLDEAGAEPGDAWTVIDATTVAFGPTFSVAGFDGQGGGVWTRAVGSTAWYEFNQGSGVLDVRAVAIEKVEVVPDGAQQAVSVVFDSTGRVYTLQFRSNLVSGAWEDLVSGAESPLTYTNDSVQGFYRIRVE